MSETLPVEMDTGSASDKYESPSDSRIRRSTLHEAEIATLLTEGRSHATPRNLYPRRSVHAGPSMATAITSKIHDLDLNSAVDSPSVGAKMWRDHHRTPPSSGGPPDLGDEYIHRRTSSRRVPFSMPSKSHYLIPSSDLKMPRSMSMNTLTAHLNDTRPISPGSYSAQHHNHSFIPRSRTQNNLQQESLNNESQHTHNIRVALEQCRKLRERTNGTPNATTELVEQLETTAHLADTLNQRLHIVVHARLDERMKSEWVPDYPSGSMSTCKQDVELSTLLRYSDDLVRSLTDSILLILRDQRMPQRSSASMSSVHTSPRHCISPLRATHRAATLGSSHRDLASKLTLRHSHHYAAAQKSNATIPHASMHSASQAAHSSSSMDSPHIHTSRLGSFWTPGASTSKSKSLYDISSLTSRHHHFNEHEDIV